MQKVPCFVSNELQAFIGGKKLYKFFIMGKDEGGCSRNSAPMLSRSTFREQSSFGSFYRMLK
jgi:hypothetical protein